ncbi:MAG: hypothetical protein DRH33_04475 [Candidatus Nealsonbacteria bacterium]|nr:MAG: hypothetical protein DRH33_04475 [Candidatus Nealsonbacteria bacterium]
MENEEIISGIREKDLETLRYYTEKAFGKIFEGKEKAKQRLIYDFLNYIKTDSRDSFLNQLLKILNTRIDDEDVKNLARLINTFNVKYDTTENFSKIAYTIIMSIMAIEEGGE